MDTSLYVLVSLPQARISKLKCRELRAVLSDTERKSSASSAMISRVFQQICTLNYTFGLKCAIERRRVLSADREVVPLPDGT